MIMLFGNATLLNSKLTFPVNLTNFSNSYSLMFHVELHLILNFWIIFTTLLVQYQLEVNNPILIWQVYLLSIASDSNKHSFQCLSRTNAIKFNEA